MEWHRPQGSYIDPELQAVLARDGLSALDRLLAGQPPGEAIPCHQIGALVRLIDQAARVGAASGSEAPSGAGEGA
jgi:hypothetical protein